MKPLSLVSWFTVEAKEYEHFTLDAGDASMLTLLICGVCIGIVIASLVTLYQRNVPGGFIRAMLRAEAHSPETAKTLAALGYEKNALIRFELKHSTIMQKLVQQATEEGSGEEPRYYIPEELKHRAEIRYESKGNGPLQFAVTVVLSVLLALLLVKLMPFVLSMIDAIL
ncbi:MAG: hypothetical protein IJW51_07585 [Clostridia bacterium]|nr:hypothetical protein [Clostridia bacterium]